MTQLEKWTLFLVRISLGWLMLYAGISKLSDPHWSAAGYLKGAKTFPAFFHWLTAPSLLPVINFVNEWGLTLLGAALILGVFLRWGTWLGALLMVLYYLPVLTFPHIGTTSYIVDDHIVYALVLLYLGASDAGKVWGLASVSRALR